MKVVGDETNLLFSIVGLGMFIRKSDVLSIEKKCRMLAQLMCQPTFPSGLNLRKDIFACKISSQGGALNFTLWILRNLVCYHCLLVLFWYTIKGFLKTGELTSLNVLQINIDLSLIILFLMWLTLTRSLFVVTLKPCLMKNMGLILYKLKVMYHFIFFLFIDFANSNFFQVF